MNPVYGSGPYYDRDGAIEHIRRNTSGIDATDRNYFNDLSGQVVQYWGMADVLTDANSPCTYAFGFGGREFGKTSNNPVLSLSKRATIMSVPPGVD